MNNVLDISTVPLVGHDELKSDQNIAVKHKKTSSLNRIAPQYQHLTPKSSTPTGDLFGSGFSTRTYQILPYYGADEPEFDKKTIKKFFLPIQSYPESINQFWQSNDQKKMICQTYSHTYLQVAIDCNRVIILPQKKENPSLDGFTKFAFSTDERYFIQYSGFYFCIVKLNDGLEEFFSPDFNLSEAQKLTKNELKPVEITNKDGEFMSMQYPDLNGCLVSRDNHAFFETNFNGSVLYLETKEPLHTFYEQMVEFQKENISMDNDKIFTKYLVKASKEGVTLKSTRQSGTPYFCILEDYCIEQVFDIDKRQMIPIEHDRSMLEKVQNKSFSHFIDADGILTFKCNELLAQYKAKSFETTIKNDKGEEEIVKQWKYQIQGEIHRFDEKDKLLSLNILKTYLHYTYFRDSSTIIIFNFVTKKIEIELKVGDCLADKKFQNSINPFINGNDCIYNMFYPSPLMNCEQLPYMGSDNRISSGIPFYTKEQLIQHEMTRSKFDPKFLNEDTVYIYDYIPQERLALLQQTINEKTSYVLFDFTQPDSEQAIIRIGDEKELAKSNDVYFTRVFTKHLETGNITWQILLTSTIWDNKQMKEGEQQQYNFACKVISVPFVNPHQSKISVLCEHKETIEAVPFYCKMKNELIVNIQYNANQDDKQQKKSQCYLHKMHVKNGCLAVQGEVISFEYVQSSQIYLYQNRRFYLKDQTTESFEIRLLVHRQKKWILKTSTKYSQLKSIWKVYAVHPRQTILIHMNDDSLYMTDSTGAILKTVIKNLFGGISLQDRNNPVDFYLRDWRSPTEKHDESLHRLNLFNNSPLSIPHQLLVRDRVFSEYDHSTKEILYRDKYDATEIQSRLKLRSYQDGYWDFQHEKIYDSLSADELQQLQDAAVNGPGLAEISNDENVVKKGEEFKKRIRYFKYQDEDILMRLQTSSMLDVLSYNILQRRYFLFNAVRFKKDLILNKLFQMIEQQKIQDVPFLFPEITKKCVSGCAFDLAIKQKNIARVQNMLDIMVNCDPEGLLNQEIVERNISEILRFNINLKNYFESLMPVYENSNFTLYPQFHAMDCSLYVPINLKENQTLSDMNHISQYQLHINSQLEIRQRESEEILFYLGNRCVDLRKYLVKNLRKLKYFFQCKTKEEQDQIKKQMKAKKEEERKKKEQEAEETEQKLEEEKHNQTKTLELSMAAAMKKAVEAKKQADISTTNDKKPSQEEDEEVVEIEYTVVNMPGLISGADPLRFMQIVKAASENDITYLEIPVIQMIINFKWKQYTENFFLFRFVKTLIFLTCFIADIIVMSPDGLDEHTDDYFSAAVITRTICAVVMLDHANYEVIQFKHAKSWGSYFKDFWNIFDLLMFFLYVAYIPFSFFYGPDQYIVKILQCSILMLFMIKFNFYLRIFDKFGFLVQMIVTVFTDMQNFLLYFCMIMSFFAIQISIIMRDVEEHEGIGSFMFFVMTLRTSLGDNDISQEYSEYKILFWIIWVIIMVVGNIVLMNFIIAVVGESYEACMEKRVAQTYKVKVDMIVERENIMSKDIIVKKKYFPSYILVRQPKDNETAQEMLKAQQAQKMQKEISLISEQVEQIRSEVKLDAIKKLVSDEVVQCRTEVKDLKKDIQNISDQMKIMLQHLKIEEKPPAANTGEKEA